MIFPLNDPLLKYLLFFLELILQFIDYFLVVGSLHVQVSGNVDFDDFVIGISLQLFSVLVENFLQILEGVLVGRFKQRGWKPLKHKSKLGSLYKFSCKLDFNLFLVMIFYHFNDSPKRNQNYSQNRRCV